MAIEILEVRNCKYVREDNSFIDCEVRLRGTGYGEDEWIPFGADPNDPLEHGRTIYTNAVNGDYGAIVAYVYPSFEVELANFRLKRNELLLETDWTQNADVSQATKDKFLTYRQELRDLTTGLDTAQKVREVTWPTKPA